MKRTMLKSKLHRFPVTGCNLEYNGSITIDRELCARADILEFEKVDIYNCNSGARFSTYVLLGGKGEICVNGAAARLVQPGDKIIIASFAEYDNAACAGHNPLIITFN